MRRVRASSDVPAHQVPLRECAECLVEPRPLYATQDARTMSPPLQRTLRRSPAPLRARRASAPRDFDDLRAADDALGRAVAGGLALSSSRSTSRGSAARRAARRPSEHCVFRARTSNDATPGWREPSRKVHIGNECTSLQPFVQSTAWTSRKRGSRTSRSGAGSAGTNRRCRVRARARRHFASRSGSSRSRVRRRAPRRGARGP